MLEELLVVTLGTEAGPDADVDLAALDVELLEGNVLEDELRALEVGLDVPAAEAVLVDLALDALDAEVVGIELETLLAELETPEVWEDITLFADAEEEADLLISKGYLKF